MYLKQESIELMKKVWEEMDKIDYPTDTNGKAIAGTPEVRRWNTMFFKVQHAAKLLQEALDAGNEESL